MNHAVGLGEPSEGTGGRQAQHTKATGGISYGVFVVVLGVALVGVCLLGVSVGAVSIDPRRVWLIVLHEAAGIGSSRDPVETQIVWEFRVPRVLLAAVVGAGLSVAGAALQATLRNPLAEPYVLGTSSGAALGAVTVILTGTTLGGSLGVSGAAFLGAILSTAMVFLLGQRAGRFSPTRMILAGVALGALFSAITSYLQIQADPRQLQGVLFWLLGTVSGAEWSDLGLPAIALLASAAWLTAHGRQLNALLIGEESAIGLGVDVNRFRAKLLVVTSLLTGTAVAVAGGIGFVGLVIPHICRMLVGSDHRRLLPVSALLGASYLGLVDVGARTLQRPVELPLGILTAALGAPFFLWLIKRNSLV